MEFNLTTEKDTNIDYKPSIYDVKMILDEEIVGEDTTKLALFAHWVLADKNVLMAGPRSSGKTFISDHISKYFLGDNCYPVTLGSAKAGWYQVKDIQESTHIIIFELNQMPADFMEVLKLWGEGKDATYKVVTMVNGARSVQTYKLPPRPYTFCLADEEELKVGEQLSSRITTLRTDNSISQNKAVLKEQAILAKSRKNHRKVDEVKLKKMSEHINTMPTMGTLIFKHPGADEFVDAVPAFFTDSRRDFPKYLANTFGITRFYWKDRILKNMKNDKRLVLVTPQDMYINHKIFWGALVDSSLKCSALERTMIDIMKEQRKSMERTEIQRELRKKGVSVSGHMVSNHMNSIADLGYVEKFKDKSKITYAMGQLFDDFKFEIDWRKVVETSKKNVIDEFPEFAEEYIKKFCDNPLVIDPFTGEEVNLMNLTIEEKKEIKPFTQYKEPVADDEFMDFVNIDDAEDI